MAVVFMELAEEVCALSLVRGSSHGIGLPEELGALELVKNNGVWEGHLCKQARRFPYLGRFVFDVWPAAIGMLVGVISCAHPAS